VEEDSHEAEQAVIRRDLAPAVEAFRARNSVALMSWAAEPTRSAAQRTYAAALRVRLGLPDSERAFVDSFPATDPESLRAIDDLEQALFRSEYEFAMTDSMTMLVCGALRGWSGALDKLIAMRPFTDAGSRVDNCCALALVAAAHPETALARFTQAGLQADVLHAFEEESSATTAKQLRDALITRSFADAEQEQLRVALLPILERKAALADGEKNPHCAWLTCEAMERRLAAQTPPNLELQLTKAPVGGR
jgi:hypothetical protein